MRFDRHESTKQQHGPHEQCHDEGMGPATLGALDDSEGEKHEGRCECHGTGPIKARRVGIARFAHTRYAKQQCHAAYHRDQQKDRSPAERRNQPASTGPKARPTPKLVPSMLKARVRACPSNSCASAAEPLDNAAAAAMPCT